MIGYSAAMVRAGVLATTLSSVEDVLTQLEEILREIDRSRKVPAPQFSKYYSVDVNQDVARSLDIETNDAIKVLSKPLAASRP